ncbi:MAG: cytochrome c [Bacteroidota bacterium]
MVTLGGRKSQPVGRAIYELNCLNCHQENGQGLGTLIPAINDPERLRQIREEIACLIRKGIEGKDSIGLNYMPAHPDLSEVQVMHITNFLLSQWGEEEEPYNIKEIRTQLEGCPSQSCKSTKGS